MRKLIPNLRAAFMSNVTYYPTVQKDTQGSNRVLRTSATGRCRPNRRDTVAPGRARHVPRPT